MSEHDESTNDFGPVAQPAEPAVGTGTGAGVAGTGVEIAAVEQRAADRPGGTADLDRIADLPLNEQPDAYQHIHDDLRRALAEIDEA